MITSFCSQTKCSVLLHWVQLPTNHSLGKKWCFIMCKTYIYAFLISVGLLVINTG